MRSTDQLGNIKFSSLFAELLASEDFKRHIRSVEVILQYASAIHDLSTERASQSSLTYCEEVEVALIVPASSQASDGRNVQLQKETQYLLLSHGRSSCAGPYFGYDSEDFRCVRHVVAY